MSVQLYTLVEIKENNGQNGAPTWIVIRDIVYDVTTYLDDHPGGRELIKDVAGRDCTKEYEDSGHSNDARQTLKQFKIGELVEEDKRANRNKKMTNKSNANDETEVLKRRKRIRFFFCA